MLRATVLLLLACLVCAASPVLPVRNVAAQSIEIGQGARVDGGQGTRVNVRREPVVQGGNVVAQTTGGTLLRVTGQERRGSHDWYAVETLADAPTRFAGWIRGDLLVPASLPETVESPAPAPEPSVRAGATVPLEERDDWSRNLLALMPAIQGCVRIGSAQPLTVHHAMAGGRGLTEVIMTDAASRRWHCVINAAGGTPVRFDPLSNAVFPRERLQRGPFFVTTEVAPQVDPACHVVERIDDPASGAQFGWLYQRTCS